MESDGLSSKHDVSEGIEIYLESDDPSSRYEIFENMEVYLGGIGRVVYLDDTQQFLDESGNEFSPRLAESALAKFCIENIEMYERFYKENISLIIRGKTPKIKSFW